MVRVLKSLDVGLALPLLTLALVSCGNASSTAEPEVTGPAIVTVTPITEPPLELSAPAPPEPSAPEVATTVLSDGLPSAQELCEMLLPEDINAAFSWAEFVVDPAMIQEESWDHPACYYAPTEPDFSSAITGLHLNAYPLDYRWGLNETTKDRSELWSGWGLLDQTYREFEIEGVPVLVLDEISIYAFFPDSTLSIQGYGEVGLPEYAAALEQLMTPLIQDYVSSD